MSFDVSADAYGRFMGRYSEPLAEIFADWAGIAPGLRALDVGCGPGALTAVLASRLGSEATTAIDPSESFVAAVRARLPEVDVRSGSAEALPFRDHAFDAALAELVVHFMKDPHLGVSEMVRVTRPAGTVAACVWDFAGARAPQSVFFRAASDVLGRELGEADRAGARSGELVGLLQDAGCSDVEEGALHVTVSYDTFDEWWDPYTLGVSPAGVLLASLDDPDREAIRVRFAQLLPDAPVIVDAVAWAARGRA